MHLKLLTQSIKHLTSHKYRLGGGGRLHLGRRGSQPRSQGLSSYRPLERSIVFPRSLQWGGKMREPGNEVRGFNGCSIL